MKVLNLYAGIGGNRKLWTDVEVTAVEIEPEIAKIYQDFFPDDKIVVGDAHQYLLEHYDEYDFIWSSPPCPTHSRMRLLCHVQEGKETPYPDMKLYEEIIFLKHWFKGKWVVENVISYYEPLIKPFESGNHYLWSNFNITNLKIGERNIRRTDENHAKLYEQLDFDLKKYNLSRFDERQLLNNCVVPELSKHIFDCAFKLKQERL